MGREHREHSTSTSTNYNVICFWAKGDEATPWCSIEFHVPGQDVWRHKIGLSTGWARYALPVSEFRISGRPDDRLNLAAATALSVAFSSEGDDFTSRDHTIWISTIQAGQFPDAVPQWDTADAVFSASTADETSIMPDVRSIGPCPNQSIAGPKTVWTGKFSGVSALMPPLYWKSRYKPLLAANDGYGRTAGWAAGLLTNIHGPCKGSVWLLAGISEPQFYKTTQFVDVLLSCIDAMRSQRLVTMATAEFDAETKVAISLKSPAPPGFVRIGQGGKRFVDSSGRPIFFTGTNYLGPADRLCSFSTAVLDSDFKRASEAGINLFRIWIGPADSTQANIDAVRECARRYGIYLLVHIGNMQRTSADNAATAKAFAAVWRDEPMVIGYDIMNEPSVVGVAAIEYDGAQSPLLQLKPYDKFTSLLDTQAIDKSVHNPNAWPHRMSWTTEDDAKQLYAADQLWQKFGLRYTENGASETTFPESTVPWRFHRRSKTSSKQSTLRSTCGSAARATLYGLSIPTTT